MLCLTSLTNYTYKGWIHQLHLLALRHPLFLYKVLHLFWDTLYFSISHFFDLLFWLFDDRLTNSKKMWNGRFLNWHRESVLSILPILFSVMKNMQYDLSHKFTRTISNGAHVLGHIVLHYDCSAMADSRLAPFKFCLHSVYHSVPWKTCIYSYFPGYLCVFIYPRFH